MKYKLVVLTIILSVLFAGCVFEKQDTTEEKITIKYVNSDPIITKNDFPDFESLDRIYYIAQDNISVSLEVEGMHRENIINASSKIPEGYRIYGISEAHNSSKDIKGYDRYILLQYKVFDSNEKLNDSMNLTAFEYARNGFKSKILHNTTYDEKIFIFESNVTNSTDINVTIILFGYDTLLGKIGVQDTKERSFDEAIKILDMTLDRLVINTKEVTPAKISFDPDMLNMSYGKENRTGNYTHY